MLSQIRSLISFLSHNECCKFYDNNLQVPSQKFQYSKDHLLCKDEFLKLLRDHLNFQPCIY